MDDKEFKTRSGRLEQIAKIIEKLPVEIRSEAFDMLKGYVIAQSSDGGTKTKVKKEERNTSDATEEEFFATFSQDRPSDNARLIAAWFYREYGSEPFSLDDIRTKADGVGITVPERLDMTFLTAQEKGKKLFTRAGTGKFRPTVHGEANLKAKYNIRKGTQKRNGDTE